MAIYKLGDIAKIISGSKPAKGEKGQVPVVGSGGIFGYTSKSKYNSETFTLPRKGTMKIFWYDQPIWNVDTAFIVGDVNKNKILKKFLYYYLISNNSWTKLITGTTRAATRITDWRELKIQIPSIDDQQKIIDIIEPIELSIKNAESQLRDIELILDKIDIRETKSQDIFKTISTGKHNTNSTTIDGKYNFYTCGSKVLKSDMNSFKGRYILLSGNGELYSWWEDGEFDLYQRVYALKEKEDFFTTLLSVRRGMKKLRSRSNGAVIKFIKISDIKSIRKLSDEKEKELSLIFIREQQLQEVREKLKIIKGNLLKTLMK